MDTAPAPGEDPLARCQFLISDQHTPLQPGFADVSTAHFAVHVHRFWPVVKVVDGAGLLIAVLFGTAIDCHQQRVVRDSIAWNAAAHGSGETLRMAFETFLYGFSGSWVCVVDHLDLRAVYCDGATTISCLYSAEKRIVAAAASQIYSDTELAPRRHRKGEIFFGGDTYFVAGLTAYDGISRLLINFRLNLATWQPERIWQAGQDNLASWSTADYAKFIAQRVRQSLTALAGDGTLAMTLTAGNESRILLSLCRGLIDKIQFYTLTVPGSRTDIRIAQQMARRFGLNHQVLHPAKRSRQQSEVWRKRTSYSVGGINAHYTSPAPDVKYAINGNYGELARGFNHESTDDAVKDLTPEDILDRLRLPATARNLKATTWWLGTLWNRDKTAVLDAAHVELRYGCWASTQIVARDEPSLWMAPLGDRAVTSAMTGLPVEFRKAEALTQAIVTECWPELLDLPVNRKSWMDHLHSLPATVFNMPVLVQKVHYEANGFLRRTRIRLGLQGKSHQPR